MKKITQRETMFGLRPILNRIKRSLYPLRGIKKKMGSRLTTHHAGYATLAGFRKNNPFLWRKFREIFQPPYILEFTDEVVAAGFTECKELPADWPHKILNFISSLGKEAWKNIRRRDLVETLPAPVVAFLIVQILDPETFSNPWVGLLLAEKVSEGVITLLQIATEHYRAINNIGGESFSEQNIDFIINPLSNLATYFGPKDSTIVDLENPPANDDVASSSANSIFTWLDSKKLTIRTAGVRFSRTIDTIFNASTQMALRTGPRAATSYACIRILCSQSIGEIDLISMCCIAGAQLVDLSRSLTRMTKNFQRTELATHRALIAYVAAILPSATQLSANAAILTLQNANPFTGQSWESIALNSILYDIALGTGLSNSIISTVARHRISHMGVIPQSSMYDSINPLKTSFLFHKYLTHIDKNEKIIVSPGNTADINEVVNEAYQA
jgi:hypothetical protein